MSFFLQFAELSDALAATSKKLEKRALIAEALHRLPADDAARTALWLAGSPFPETDARSLNIGGSLLVKAVTQLTRAGSEALSAAWRRHGDVGSAAADLLQDHAPAEPSLTLAAVESAFAVLAAARGPAQKLPLLLDLLARATALEAKYLIKLIAGDMRTGVRQSLVEEGIAQACNAPLQQVRRASMLLGSLPQVVALATQGRLAAARMNLFHPLGFMLASPVASVDEAIARCAEETRAETASAGQSPRWHLEDKYDGIRAQLHIAPAAAGPSRIALYSRNREDLSAAFPDLVDAFADIGEPAILDGEILAWNTSASRALPFAALQQRLGRKRVTPEMLRDIPAVFVVFDILYRGDSLLPDALLMDDPLARRRQVLEDFAVRWSPCTAKTRSRGQAHLFAEESAFPRLILSAATPFTTALQLEQAYADARARGNEGVMLKSLLSPCQPGRRGLAWLKLKRELATLDVVVTGVEFGNGRRAQVLSDYTFAIRDTDAGSGSAVYRNIGKAYSGLTDREIAGMTEFFKAHTLENYGHFRAVEPVVVLEVAFNNVMRSARHDSGFALRFPRIVRIRTDKPVEEIDTLRRVEEIYNAQPDKPVEP